MTLMQIKRRKSPNDRLEKIKKQVFKSDCIKFSMNIPVSLHRKFKIKAFHERKDMSEILIDMMANYIK